MLSTTHYLKDHFRNWCGLLSIDEIMTNTHLIEAIKDIEKELLKTKSSTSILLEKTKKATTLISSKEIRRNTKLRNQNKKLILITKKLSTLN